MQILSRLHQPGPKQSIHKRQNCLGEASLTEVCGQIRLQTGYHWDVRGIFPRQISSMISHTALSLCTVVWVFALLPDAENFETIVP